MSRWTLPGPDQFLGDLVSDLHHGGAVVGRLPSTIPVDDVEAEVTRRLPYTLVETVDASEPLGGRLPGDVVAAHAGVGGAGWTAAGLAAVEELSGRVISITGAEQADGEEWASWVAEFASAAASGDAAVERPVVLMLLSGRANGAGSPEDPRMRVHWWWGALDRLDVAVHLKRTVPELDPVDREQIIEVAGADLELAERLGYAACRDEDEIAGICLERSRELGLSDMESAAGLQRLRLKDEPGALETHWCVGAVDSFEGRVHWHPGLLAGNGRGALQRRLWTAQVRALLPTVDLLRLDLIETVRRHGLLPEGVLTLDLEVGDLARHLAKVDWEHGLGELADWLRRTRNLLAHLEVVPAASRDRGRELAARAKLQH